MSYVTNVMVSHSAEPPAVREALTSVNLGPEGRPQHVRTLTEFLAPKGEPNPGNFWGGNKWPECNVYGAAVNYFDWEGALERLAAVPWQYPHDVQVFIQDQEDDAFSLYMIRDGSFKCILMLSGRPPMKTDPTTPPPSLAAVLDELEGVARNAPNPEEPWTYAGAVTSLPLDIAASPYDPYDLGIVDAALWERVARHIAAFDPPTALALIAVARAAYEAVDVSGWPAEANVAEERVKRMQALRAALGRLTEGRAE